MNQSPQTSPQPGGPGRPGQMTAVMRAMQQSVGPKVLRIGLVQSGKVIEERVIKQRSHVTIGPSEKSMFVLPTKAIPPNFKLFELVGNDYVLNFLEGMTGRVALKTGISDLAALRGQAKRVQQGPVQAFQIPLSEDARGKVVIAETTFLFQFVAPPPVQPKPQLPLSVKSGVDIDWTTTIIAAFSFLVHFGLIGTIWSDPYDRDLSGRALELSELAKKVATLPAPPPDTKEDPDAVDTAAATATATADAPKEAAKPAQNNQGSAKMAPNSGAPRPTMSDSQASALTSQLDSLNVSMQSVLNGAGESTNNILNSDSALPNFDDASRSNTGIATGPGNLHMGGPGYRGKPGEVGSTGLNQTGNTGGDDKQTDSGQAVQKKAPKGSAAVGGASVSGGTVANAGSVVAGMAAGFRACYNRGLAENPDMKGTVRITAKIGPAGEVQSASASGGGNLSGTVIGCVQARVAGAQFSAPDGGGATLVIPVTFQPQN